MRYCILLVGFILVSCVGNRPHIDIIGSWGIEEIKYNEESYLPFLHTNLICFYEGGRLSLPESDYFEKEENARWSYIEKTNRISIECTDLMFKGQYDIEYTKTSVGDPIEIILVSETKIIRLFDLAYKG